MPAKYTPLGWDTRVLGRSCGRIEMQHPNGGVAGIQRAFREGVEDGVEFIVARVDTDQPDIISCLQDLGFRVVSTLQRMRLSKPPDPQDHTFTKGPNPELEIRLVRPEDVSRVGELAAGGFVHSRIHNDPVFSEGLSHEFYAAWARAACLGDVHDGVLVAVKGDRILGYMIYEMEAGAIGRFVLMSVDPKARRMGVARSLAISTIEILHKRGANFIEAGAEATSVAVLNLYISMGFFAHGPWTSLHWHKEA